MRSRTLVTAVWALALGCSRCSVALVPSETPKNEAGKRKEESRGPDLARDVFERSARVDTYGEERTELVAVGSGVQD